MHAPEMHANAPGCTERDQTRYIAKQDRYAGRVLSVAPVRSIDKVRQDKGRSHTAASAALIARARTPTPSDGGGFFLTAVFRCALALAHQRRANALSAYASRDFF
jgi:hypothetical protein